MAATDPLSGQFRASLANLTFLPITVLYFSSPLVMPNTHNYKCMHTLDRHAHVQWIASSAMRTVLFFAFLLATTNTHTQVHGHAHTRQACPCAVDCQLSYENGAVLCLPAGHKKYMHTSTRPCTCSPQLFDKRWTKFLYGFPPLSSISFSGLNCLN